MEGATTSTWEASKSDSPKLHDGMVIWNNLAFSLDEEEEDEESLALQEKCSISSPAAIRGATSDHEGSVVIKHVVEEDQEMKFREELEKEIEKQLEQEIMEGIHGLVRKLSNLKAKRIIRSLKKFDMEDLLNILYGSSFDFSCKLSDDDDDDDTYGSPRWEREYSGQRSSAASVREYSNESEEEVFEDLKKESRLKTLAYYNSE